MSKLGTPNDRLRFELEVQRIDQFRDDSALARQIIRDRPDSWEYRVTAEFLRDYLKRTMRGWSDLQRNLYSKSAVMLTDEESIEWFRARIAEASRLVPVLVVLYTEELARAWGSPGEPGDPVEIKHVCKLIQSAAEQLLQWEESVRFVSVAESYAKLFACLPDALGKQLDQLRSVPHQLDEVADWIDTNPAVGKEFHHKLVFDLPDGWADRVQKELEGINKRGNGSNHRFRGEVATCQRVRPHCVPKARALNARLPVFLYGRCGYRHNVDGEQGNHYHPAGLRLGCGAATLAAYFRLRP